MYTKIIAALRLIDDSQKIVHIVSSLETKGILTPCSQFVVEDFFRSCAVRRDYDSAIFLQDYVERHNLKKSVVIIESLIFLHTQQGDIERATDLFVKHKVNLHESTLKSIIEKCTDPNISLTLYGAIKKGDYLLDTTVGYAIIQMFVRCGLLDAALKALPTLMKRTMIDYHSYNFLMNTCLEARLVREGLEVHELFHKQKGFMETVSSKTSLLKLYLAIQSYEDAVTLFQDMKTEGTFPDMNFCTILLEHLVEANDLASSIVAKYMYSLPKEYMTIQSLEALIKYETQFEQYDKAVELLKTWKEPLKIDELTYLKILASIEVFDDEIMHIEQKMFDHDTNETIGTQLIWLQVRQGKWQRGYEKYVEFVKNGMKPSAKTFITLLEGATTQEKLEKVREEIRVHGIVDIDLYNAALKAWNRFSDFKLVEKVFYLDKGDLKPNSRSIKHLLDALMINKRAKRGQKLLKWLQDNNCAITLDSMRDFIQFFAHCKFPVGIEQALELAEEKKCKFSKTDMEPVLRVCEQLKQADLLQRVEARIRYPKQ
jgi:pentatricopeptide repeat protein